MQVLIVAMYINSDPKGPMPTAQRRNPLDDLIERMRCEMQRSRDSAAERTTHGTKVAG